MKQPGFFRYLNTCTLTVLCSLAPLTSQAQETVLLWGDTHLHTSNSTDGYGSGNLEIDPDMAYRFAKGQPILHPVTNARLHIPRALDFLVVADHSDYLGLQVYLQKDDPRLTDNPRGQRLREMALADPASVFRLIFNTNAEFTGEQLLETYKPIQMEPWLDEIRAAERHNEPGVFTAIAGWEWSSHDENRNLHRVVFSPAGPDKLSSFFPYSNLDSTRPEDLWAWLEKTAQATGEDFIAIPHNSNMSTGLMFAPRDSEGEAFTPEYARTRARWEPVVEITQVKGTSEVHPALSTNDEFAEFEVLRRLFMPREPEPAKGDYVRSALLTGLEQERQLGVNPFNFGVIGSSDIHTGLSITEENDFYGAVMRDTLLTTRQAAPRNRAANLSVALNAWELSASGLAAVWAKENTRTAIAEASKRKEVYATSGPRIALRVFGGFDFASDAALANDLAAVGYANGKPMGSDLGRTSSGKAVTLLIDAVKDPQGANLDRVQVIKGWLDNSGVSREKIFDVSWSGQRNMDASGKLSAVGTTVDANSASYNNTIGAPQLSVVWQDPQFNPDESAFYYVRVLEIPTPRHQVYDAVALGIDPLETAQPLSIQERAWSSPIWYRPKL